MSGTVLVAGANGNVGGAVVRALRERGARVRALVRSAEPKDASQGVETVVGDLADPASLRDAYEGVSAAFLLAGFDGMPALLEDMLSAGVETVVLLSSGAVVGGDPDNVVVRFNAVSESAVRDSGLGWTVLRPSGFMSNTLQWVDQLASGNEVREPFADVPIAVVDPDDIGAVAAVALVENGHTGRSYRLTGPEPLLPSDRARILGAALGRELTLVPEPDAEARERMSGTMPAEYVDAFFQFFRRGGYDDSHVTGVVTDLLGRPARTFAQWVDAHRGAFA